MAAEEGAGAGRASGGPVISQIATPRFVLRAVEAGDVDALLPAFCDPDAMRYWSRGPFDNRAQFAEWLLDASWGGRTWVAVPKAGGDPVARLVASEARPGVAEIGYLVLPGHARQGIGGECVAALVTHLFRAEGYSRVFADTDPRNTPSNRLLQRLGFTREAHLRSAMETHIGWCDTWLWGVLADEWRH
ncbi:GNAT family N-acetyltransferase [Alteraurantiacibacter lauratis]|uniref:GNAT family N-acetyltransferase n=2 Tax=Alteraurantiacibacter lauratis TaxID=2054627 RepID=A0ABV7EG22_9SPHN